MTQPSTMPHTPPMNPGGSAPPARAPAMTFRWWLLLFAGAGALYFATLAPGLVWQDSGEVQLRCLLNEFYDDRGLARCHILFYLAVWAVKWVPVGTVAWKANAVSAIFGAVTVANVGWAAGRWCRDARAGAIAAVMLMCSHTLWQLSAMAETYSLSAALLSAELCMLVKYREDGQVHWLWLLGLFNGLGLSDHNLALLSLAVYVAMALVLIRRWPRPRWKFPVGAAMFWCIGFAPMALLVAIELGTGIGPTGVVSSFLFAKDYREQVLNVSIGLPEMANAAGVISLNFPTPLLLLLPVGCWTAWRRGGRRITAVITLLLLIHLGFAARYNIVDQYTFFIPSCVLISVLVAWGIKWVLDPAKVVPGRAAHARLVTLVALALTGPPIYALAAPLAERIQWTGIPLRPVPYRNPYRWFLQPWHAGYDGPERFACETLSALPDDAVLLADSTMRAPLLYLQNAEGLRRDVLINTGRWQHWRREPGHTWSDLLMLAERRRLFATSNVAAYFAQNPALLRACDVIRVGHVYQLVHP